MDENKISNPQAAVAESTEEVKKETLKISDDSRKDNPLENESNETPESQKKWDKIKNEIIVNEIVEKNLITEDEYKKYIKNKIKKFNKTIHFNINKTWYFLIAFIRSNLTEDITALFSLSKNFKSDESKLAYGSTAKDSIIFSNFLLKIYNELELEKVITNLYKWTNLESKISLNNDATLRVGSNRAIESQKVKDFFSYLKNEIEKSNNSIDKFNLFSIYTRVALGILLGTRTFNYSC